MRLQCGNQVTLVLEKCTHETYPFATRGTAESVNFSSFDLVKQRRKGTGRNGYKYSTLWRQQVKQIKPRWETCAAHSDAVAWVEVGRQECSIGDVLDNFTLQKCLSSKLRVK